MTMQNFTQFANCYAGKKVFLTGHTGFKGSWLALWLKELGAEVTGYALDPETSPNHWSLLTDAGLLGGVHDLRHDIRDAAAVQQAVQAAAPDIVFHLAAQPLVRRSYRAPLDTWATNVMGTANLLEACRHTPSVQAVVVITTDKCYENVENRPETHLPFKEDDRLGGHDPYSASKAGTELVVASYRASFFNTPQAALVASARAGNVIGGGDWSEDRLIPDLMRALSGGPLPDIRFPNATRPWQHVLESVSGYLLLGQRLLAGDATCARAWNFGPAAHDQATVANVLARMKAVWPELAWNYAAQAEFHEAQSLQLDSSLAHTGLQWQPIWDLQAGVEATAHWYQDCIEGKSLSTAKQLHAYIAAAHAAGVVWCAN